MTNNRKELKALLKASKKVEPIKEKKCSYGETHRCDLNCRECPRNTKN
jgi:hypothetical protein